MTIALSYGGGVQSVAICVLIKEGALPIPDLAGICDTGRERRTTWSYMEEVVLPYLAPTGLSITRIPHSLSLVDLYAPTGDGRPLMPVYTKSNDPHPTLFGDPYVREGRLPNYCSGPWKRDTFERWLRSMGVKECDCWIGFSTDEAERVKNDHRDWCHYRHPLINLGISRQDCLRIITRAGLPAPNKSRCWACPHQTDEEWAEVRADPVDWPLAVALDEEIREADPEGEAGLFLSSQRVPLPLMVMGGEWTPARPCEAGHCWT